MQCKDNKISSYVTNIILAVHVILFILCAHVPSTRIKTLTLQGDLFTFFLNGFCKSVVITFTLQQYYMSSY